MPLAQTWNETPRPKPNPKSHIGYLTCRPDGLTGTQGAGYDYIVARNGLFIQASNELLTVRTLIARAEIRGLVEVQAKVEPAHGPIPSTLFELGLRWMQTNPHTEQFFAIQWDGERYRLTIPKQKGTSSSLKYEHDQSGRMIAEFHSHGRLPAFFSTTDDQDEQGFRIYGVVGKTENETPELALRTGIYGHHAPALWQHIFEGPSPCQEPESLIGKEKEPEDKTLERITRAMQDGRFP